MFKNKFKFFWKVRKNYDRNRDFLPVIFFPDRAVGNFRWHFRAIR